MVLVGWIEAYVTEQLYPRRGERNFKESDKGVEVSRREHTAWRTALVSNRILKGESSKKSRLGILKLGTSEEDVFRGFQVIAKVAERRVGQMHSMQVLLCDDHRRRKGRARGVRAPP